MSIRTSARLSRFAGYESGSGSIRLGSLFLILPTRALTGQQIMSSEEHGARSAFRCGRPDGSLPSHCGHTSGLEHHGRPVASFAHNSYGVVVTIVKLRMRFAGGRAQGLTPRQAAAVRYRRTLPVPTTGSPDYRRVCSPANEPSRKYPACLASRPDRVHKRAPDRNIRDSIS
jgi:hypothetical protein